MVFNVIACFIQGKEEPELERYAQQAVASGSRGIGEVYTVNVQSPFSSITLVAWERQIQDRHIGLIDGT